MKTIAAGAHKRFLDASKKVGIDGSTLSSLATTLGPICSPAKIAVQRASVSVPHNRGEKGPSHPQDVKIEGNELVHKVG